MREVYLGNVHAFYFRFLRKPFLFLSGFCLGVELIVIINVKKKLKEKGW